MVGSTSVSTGITFTLHPSLQSCSTLNMGCCNATAGICGAPDKAREATEGLGALRLKCADCIIAWAKGGGESKRRGLSPAYFALCRFIAECVFHGATVRNDCADSFNGITVWPYGLMAKILVDIHGSLTRYPQACSVRNRR
eukprot:184062-Amphidinium_carterae.1